MLVQHLLAIPFQLDFFEEIDINLMIECLLPNDIKMNVTLENIRMRTNLIIRSISTIPKDPSVKFTKKVFSTHFQALGFLWTSMSLSKRRQEATRVKNAF